MTVVTRAGVPHYTARCPRTAEVTPWHHVTSTHRDTGPSGGQQVNTSTGGGRRHFRVDLSNNMYLCIISMSCHTVSIIGLEPTRPGCTVLTKPNHSVYPGLGRLKTNYRYCMYSFLCNCSSCYVDIVSNVKIALLYILGV